MFDGIKIQINDIDLCKRLLHDPKLDFIESTDMTTGEIKGQTADYKSFKINIYSSGLIYFTGSIHKFHNGGVQNYDDYTLQQASDTIIQLTDDLGIDPHSRLHNLEFGCNLNVPFPPNDFIDRLRAYKKTPFNIMEVKTPGHGKQTLRVPKKTRRILKIYNKGLQYGQLTTNTILRYEFKVIKMEVIRKEPIYLDDLTDPALYNRCKDLLLASVNDLIIDEPIEGIELTKEEKTLLNNYSHQRSSNTLSRMQRLRQREKYRAIIEQKNIYDYRGIIHQLLVEKINELLINVESICYVMTDVQKPVMLHYDSLCIESDCNTLNVPTRHCKTCGRDISTQRAGSQYCSEKIYGKGAKKCRNTDSNPRNNFEHKIHQVLEKGVLFDIMPFFKIVPAGLNVSNFRRP